MRAPSPLLVVLLLISLVALGCGDGNKASSTSRETKSQAVSLASVEQEIRTTIRDRFRQGTTVSAPVDGEVTVRWGDARGGKIPFTAMWRCALPGGFHAKFVGQCDSSTGRWDCEQVPSR
jgi:hypothetical protein